MLNIDSLLQSYEDKMDVSQDFTDNPRISLRHLRGIGHKLCGSGRHACRTLGGSVALGF